MYLPNHIEYPTMFEAMLDWRASQIFRNNGELRKAYISPKGFAIIEVPNKDKIYVGRLDDSDKISGKDVLESVIIPENLVSRHEIQEKVHSFL